MLSRLLQKDPLLNKFIIQRINFNTGRGTRAYGRPRLCTSVGSIWSKHRRSVVRLWRNDDRTSMFHVSTWDLLELLV